MYHFALSGSNFVTLTFQNSYFSSSDWAEDKTLCGHCDNCTRDLASVIERDVTLDAKRMLAIARVLHSKKIKVTAAQLAQAARGLGPHVKPLQLSTNDRTKLSSHVCSLMLIRHGVNPRQKMQECDILIAHMLLNKFLDKLVTSNAYKVQIYLKPGALSRRLDEGEKLCVQLPLPERARNNHRAGDASRAGGKRTSADADVVENCDGEDGEEDRVEMRNAQESFSAAKRRRRASYNQHHASSSRVPAAAWEMSEDVGVDADYDSENESEDLEWKGNLRGAPAVTHRTLRNKSSVQSKASVASRPSGALEVSIYDNEVIDISSE